MSSYQSYPSSSYGAPQQTDAATGGYRNPTYDPRQGGGSSYGGAPRQGSGYANPSYAPQSQPQQQQPSYGTPQPAQQQQQQPNGRAGGGGYAEQPSAAAYGQPSNAQRDYVSRPQGDQQQQQPSQTYVLPPPKAGAKGRMEGHGVEAGPEEKRMWREDAKTWGWGEFFRSFLTRNQIAFLSLLLLQAIVILVMICIVFAKIEDNVEHTTPKLRSIITYLTIFIFAEIFEMIAAIDALRLKNTIQLVFLCLFNGAIMLYGCLVPDQIQNALAANNPDSCTESSSGQISGSDPDLTCFAVLKLYHEVNKFLLVIPIVSGVFTLIMAYISWRLYAEFGWDVYKKIGASLTLKSIYLYYQVYVCFLKFDAFFLIATLVQYLILVLSGEKETEFAVTIAALPITIVLLVIAAVTVRLEIRWAMWLIFVGEALGLSYMIYKLFRIFEPSQSYKYKVSRRTMTTFTVITLLMLGCTIVSSIICYMNFGKGLRDHIPPYFPSISGKRRSTQKPVIDDHEGGADGDAPGGPPNRSSGTRMTLD